MKEKQNIKISLSTFFLVISIIIIVIMGYFTYKLYVDNKMYKDNVKELNDKVSNLENTTSQLNDSDTIKEEEKNQIEELDISSSIVQQIYDYVLKYDDSYYCFAWQNSMEPASFYKDTKMTYSTLTNMEKMLDVLKNYKISEIKSENKSNLANIIDTEYINDEVKVYKDINKKSKQIFNENNSDWKDYEGLASKLTYNNDCYYLSLIEGGGKGTSEKGYSKIQKAEKDGEYIYIYDKYLYVDSTNMDIGYGDSKIHIYTSADKTTDIGSESKVVPESELYQKYEDKLKTYKHTFKKANDGSYYWVSSEVNE